jgi:L-arabinose transport system substrate-binding protein
MRYLCAPLGLLTLVGLAAPALAQDEITIAYINKLEDIPWFVAEVAGAQAEADALGITVTHQGVQSDSNKAISALDTNIAAGVDGVIIVVPDQAIGPAVMERVAAAGIPVIAVDDGILDAEGNPAPFVGFEATAIGQQVGHAIADMHAELGWGDQAADDTYVLSVEVQGLSVCMDRTDNANAVLSDRLGVPEDHVIHIPYDPGTLDRALAAASQTLVAVPQAQRFLVHACNDEGVLGAVRALEQAGVGADATIGVGIGGQLGCEEFRKDEVTGFRGTIYVDSTVHGRTAVQLMHANLTAGTEIPARTIIDGILVTKADTQGVAECQ